MFRYKILNSREKNKLLEGIAEIYGIPKLSMDEVFLRTAKGRLYITNRDIEKVPLEKLRINSIGLYFAMQDKMGLRLSVEGSQIIGRLATKNIIILNKQQMEQWFSGFDIPWEGNNKFFVIIKHSDDILGSGKLSNGIMHNYLGKERRIKLKESFL